MSRIPNLQIHTQTHANLLHTNMKLKLICENNFAHACAVHDLLFNSTFQNLLKLQEQLTLQIFSFKIGHLGLDLTKSIKLSVTFYLRFSRHQPYSSSIFLSFFLYIYLSTYAYIYTSISLYIYCTYHIVNISLPSISLTPCSPLFTICLSLL